MQTSTDAYAAEMGDLERLAAELTARGLDAVICTPAGRLPYLNVANPRVAMLSERVYASAEAFWFSWAERIAGCHDVAVAAGMVAQVLRTVDGE